MPHSPGPWTVEASGRHFLAVQAADDTAVCLIAAMSRRCEADARLLAAAPELLAALRALDAVIDFGEPVAVAAPWMKFGKVDAINAALEASREALRKAEGR